MTLTPGPYLDVFARRQRDGWTCPAVGTFCDECGTRLSDAYGQVRACPMCEEAAA